MNCENDILSNFELMAELSSRFTGEENEKEFMEKLLSVAIESIPEAEAGSIWLIDNTLYRAVAGYNYKEGIIENLVVPLEDAYIHKYLDSMDIIEINSFEEFTSPSKLFQDNVKLIHAKHETMITLAYPLKVGNKVKGHIYIDNFKLKRFSETAKKSLKIFGSFASTFLTLKSLRDEEKNANELNSIYLSFITHEVRTPLTAILGYAESILRGNKDLTKDEIIDLVKRIYMSSRHMNSLITDLSTFNKLNREEELNISEVHLKFLIYESISIVEPQLSPEVELNIKFGENIPEMIETDPIKMKQILVNIVGNAIKYTDQGYVNVSIDFDEKTKEYIIIVKDSGPGMPEDKLEDVFKPFVRLAKNKPGSGLGLAIVKKLIEKLKGRIRIDSKVGEGTTVELRFPQKIH
ncbi:His Kinase A (phospho-acceptor) domain-containing protein [Marinitoga hydrogenitolerans DSM 16785]|uniref:histidine kinase n=1 Tax=Marinitoga hydrogenitolerans (strain DSM 16785 / JCM 12826 / AT1271) TaxID=1122195 RepID=A0A1M4TDJ9_MARH1|nr:GAF domain-containing sensor histidine kinase [Marinitoga hydrogenitolerans]SHE42530.1 His Kinase A (phospho-acceptor) domain-containing protein [Marinitoga hydrogenitolerans DSM 16785]